MLTKDHGRNIDFIKLILKKKKADFVKRSQEKLVFAKSHDFILLKELFVVYHYCIEIIHRKIFPYIAVQFIEIRHLV